MRTVKASTTIHAPIEKVWEILTDTASYPDWNPFVVKITPTTKPDVGTLMTFTVRWISGGGTTSKELVTGFHPPKTSEDGTKATWLYSYQGLAATIYMIRGHRTQTLTALSEDVTRYDAQEVFTGWGSFLVPFKKVKQGFEAQGAGLKAAAEKA